MSRPATDCRLRRFPYPFRAGLAICSDIDLCGRETFLAVHRLLNLDLGLPTADSLFGQGQTQGQLAYLQADGRTLTRDADLLERAVADGLIDSLHTWGDFNRAAPDGPVLRALAEEVTRRLSDNGLGLKVWINHGDQHNRQNLLCRLQPGYLGDDPGSPHYTADLLPALGIEYCWLNELVSWPLSGRRSPGHSSQWSRLAVNAAKNLVKRITGRGSRVRGAAQITSLARPLTLRDQSRVWDFSRFLCYPEPSTRHTLRHNLAARPLRKLLEAEGYQIIYTHLGRPPDADGALFPAEDLAALRHLSDLHRAGDIWVAATSRLLAYWRCWHHLRWRVEPHGPGAAIVLEAVDDPLTGPRRPQTEELAGICFETPRPEQTVIRLGDEPLPARQFGPDRQGRRFVGFDPPPAPRTDLLG